MSIIVEGGITIGGGIIIGDVPVFISINNFITENSNNLITETGDQFIEEN
jgi:hypothetical protein